MKNKDFEIAKEDFDTSYAKILKKDPKRLKAFKRRIVADFNKNQNLSVFLMGLRILVMAGGVTRFANKTKIKRPNVYRLLDRNANPGFSTLMGVTKELGINFQFTAR